MMSAFPDRAKVEQAIAWHLRLKDADENAWIEFAEWLDVDPAHNGIYEAVVDGDARMLPLLERATFPADDEHQRPSEFNNDEDGLAHNVGGKPGRQNRWRWGGF